MKARPLREWTEGEKGIFMLLILFCYPAAYYYYLSRKYPNQKIVRQSPQRYIFYGLLSLYIGSYLILIASMSHNSSSSSNLPDIVSGYETYETELKACLVSQEHGKQLTKVQIIKPVLREEEATDYLVWYKSSDLFSYGLYTAEVLDCLGQKFINKYQDGSIPEFVDLGIYVMKNDDTYSVVLLGYNQIESYLRDGLDDGELLKISRLQLHEIYKNGIKMPEGYIYSG